MNQKLALVFSGLLILSVAGCSAGKNYWLVYKHNPKTVPEATYQGYYSSDTGTQKDDVIEECLSVNDHKNNDPNKTETPKEIAARERCKKLHTNDSGEKPSLTDDDQAKVVVHVPNGISEDGLECEIKQTKITRPAFHVYSDAETIQKGAGPIKPTVYLCDLHLTDAGGMRLDFAVQKPKGEKTESQKAGTTTTETITTKSGVVNDSIEVHTLYRFRVLVGPVYSSISDSKDRTYTAKAHSGGTSYVASDANGNPVHAAAFLKYYWKPRDVYDTKFCLRDENGAAVSKITTADPLNSFFECLGRINPIVGLGISDNPLKNVYVGGSLDILPGLDIVGGIHWSSVQTLSGGFTQGQIVPSGTIIPMEQRFLPGWFVGIAVDTGVAGTWITKATTSLFK